MCKYCRREGKRILGDPILEQDFYSDDGRRMGTFSAVIMSDAAGEPQVKLNIDDVHGESVLSGVAKIRFCPFCGEKLADGTEDTESCEFCPHENPGNFFNFAISEGLKMKSSRAEPIRIDWLLTSDEEGREFMLIGLKSGDPAIIEEEYPVYYCPMCGRPLPRANDVSKST